MTDTVGHLEIEIKLNLESFADYLKLIGHLGHIEHEEHHLNGFFDSERRTLGADGWALRVRVENERGLVTVKSIPAERGLAVVRQEIEAEIGRGEAFELLNLQKDILSMPIMPVEFVREKYPDLSLAKLIQFENVRQKKLYRIGDQNYLLEIDKTEYSDGSVDYELEIELQEPDRIELIEDDLRRLFTSLDIPFQRQGESKLHRALTRAGLL
jgi:uncharacterized protein YjbK